MPLADGQTGEYAVRLRAVESEDEGRRSMDGRKGLLVALGVVLVAACGATPPPPVQETAPAEVEVAAEPAADTAAAADRHDVVYVCSCGPDCSCDTVSTTPGTCTCGKDLGWAHVVKVEGDEALLCTCEEGCTCALDPADPTKCGCGSEIRRMSLKGTGLYFCNCGGECTCNHISAEPGNCGCGMELKTAA